LTWCKLSRIMIGLVHQYFFPSFSSENMVNGDFVLSK
jgi:hypothetical protein